MPGVRLWITFTNKTSVQSLQLISVTKSIKITLEHGSLLQYIFLCLCADECAVCSFMDFDLTESSAFSIIHHNISWDLLWHGKWWLKIWQELSIKMMGRYQPEECTLNVFSELSDKVNCEHVNPRKFLTQIQTSRVFSVYDFRGFFFLNRGS